VADAAANTQTKEPAVAALAIDRLTVRYYGRAEDALSDVSVAVPAGVIVSVAGRNGAGKSTLALAAAGFIPRIVRAQVSGEVRVAGHSDDGDAAGRTHRVGIVFPNPANQMSATKATVREELAFGLENLGSPRAEMDARIDDVLARLGIAHLAERSPFGLSGGEQQRVAIASIVAMGMAVVVLDEPTAQLDPLATTAVGEVLRDLAGNGTAILVAEHAPAILGRTARCVVLDSGRVAAEGPPGEVLRSTVVGPLGFHPPTLVALAEAAGVPPAKAFDEEAIVTALAGRRLNVSAARGPAGPAVEWRPVRSHSPTGVSIRGLVHRYRGGVEALRGVDLDVAPGEAVAIVGQNGSGKTTLVKHLNGLLRPDSGTVRIGERDVSAARVHELAATVGFVFQNPDDQLFNRSVEREMRFGPRNIGLPAADIDALVGQALEAIGLTGQRSENPYDLNVSSRKLVALGSVLAMDPAVIVLDEPTTGQDGPGVARVGAIVDALGAAGRTVLAITHDMEFAAAHFSRVVVMRGGEIIAQGPPGEIFAARNADLLATTGLTPPPAARIAARLGLDEVPPDAETLLSLLRAQD
jgi:energy-coupling factor transport system ATP-binding protein